MINLIKGECLEQMKKIPDGSVDAIITDPPYGTTACKWDSVIDFELMWEQLNRIIKPNGAIVLFGSEPFSSALRMSNLKSYRYDWIWEKSKATGFQNSKIQPMRKYENLSVFYKHKPTYNPQGLVKKENITSNVRSGNIKNKHSFNTYKGKKPVAEFTNYPTNIIKFKNASGKGHLHPTQKPILLMEYLIKTYTNENETVLDFTMGSGTTGVACVNTNRNFIGIELDDKYFEIAENRINKL